MSKGEAKPWDYSSSCRLDPFSPFVESQHLIEHHREQGPTAYVDAAEIAEFGIDLLIKEAVMCLRLSQDNVDWAAPPENQRIALASVKHDGSRPPPPPFVGPADSYFHCVWIDTGGDEPSEDYAELDTDREPMRWVKTYRDGRLEAYRYARDNWRDVSARRLSDPHCLWQ